MTSYSKVCMYVCISLLNRVPRVDQLFKYRISSNNSQGDNYFLSHQKGTDDYFEGGNYFKYCSLEVVP